jgi:hypothetical protein
VRWSEEELAMGMQSRESKRECVGCSRMCFKLKRGHSERKLVLAAGGERGGRGRSSGSGGGSVAHAGDDSGENWSGGRPGSDAWGQPGAGGGVGRAATTASSGGEQFGRWQSGVARRGEASAVG